MKSEKAVAATFFSSTRFYHPYRVEQRVLYNEPSKTLTGVRMPPFLPRKRLRSESPEADPSNLTAKGKGRGSSRTATPRKPTLFDDLDAGTRTKRTAEHGKALLEKLAAAEDDESSLSSLSSEDEFEDVPSAKWPKMEEDEDEDEDIEFEDVQTHAAPPPSASAPALSGDLELTLRKDTRISLTNPHGTKKGPSKIERGIRIATHQIHVQMLMWHNAVRNSWLCDKEVQSILVSQLTPGLLQEVEKWRRHSGLPEMEELKPKSKGKGKARAVKGKKVDPRSQRDWGLPAERLATGEVNVSAGDPLFKLLEILKPYWKQRFRITAPGLRKLGYMSLERLDAEMKSFNNEEHDPVLHGERIKEIEEFKELARKLEGSRDVGAQLFTALLRGLGLEARMVASLQPSGFGWGQNEEALVKNPRKLKKKAEIGVMVDDSSDEEGSGEEDKLVQELAKKEKAKPPAKSKKAPVSKKQAEKRTSQNNLSEHRVLEDDDESVIDVTPARPQNQQSLPYDKDLLFPHYWTEVLSPVSNTYVAVDAIVLGVIASNEALLERFEPRGAKAEKAKQVTSYIIGHSPDGTAKDVTTRYLKRHVWPGRTKGNRIPVEKVPVHNRHGKVKYYEEYDWFKTVMSCYTRGTAKCPRTDIDDHEEATILKPVKPAKKVVEEGKETLQSYKSSAEFVLERHLKREEAVVPGSTHVKMFIIKGKRDDTIEEKVFLRKDVVSCKSMETWHKEGRAPIDGEEPLKRVPYRAATTNRRRELAEAEQATGGKVLQGLYSRDQTDWIIPPPIRNGIIPKNSFGNIDLYVDSMLPEGAVHIPKRQTMRICKRIGIDYAEAVVGFEFGHRMAVPIISGVVVATENYEAVMEEWEKDEAERVRKEDEKRTRTAIGLWRKMLMGMRIIKRVREEYGDEVDNNPDVLNPWTNHKANKHAEAQARIMEQRDEEMAGGFLPEGHDEEEADGHHSSSFFPVVHEDDDDHGGGFIVEGHDEPAKSPSGQAYVTPNSFHSSKARLASDEDEEMQDIDNPSETEVPQPKKRGRPAGSANKTPKSTPKSRITKIKKPTPRSTPASSTKNARKRKEPIPDSEEDEGESSLPSSLSSDSESELEDVPRKVAKAAGRKVAIPTSSRKRPKRKAASMLKSPYFEHNDDE
jgi:xeroderma pigmentosum group C-complementing protein